MKIYRATLVALFLAFIAACAASVHPAVGVWDIEMETPLGDIDADLTIDRDGDGTLMTEEFGVSPIRNVLLNDDDVAFVTTDAQGRAMTFNGTVRGNSLVGTLSGEGTTFAITGTRDM